jgi:hypothetical protein
MCGQSPQDSCHHYTLAAPIFSRARARQTRVIYSAHNHQDNSLSSVCIPSLYNPYYAELRHASVSVFSNTRAVICAQILPRGLRAKLQRTFARVLPQDAKTRAGEISLPPVRPRASVFNCNNYAEMFACVFCMHLYAA